MRGAIAGNRTTGPPAYIAGALTLSYNGMDSIIRTGRLAGFAPTQATRIPAFERMQAGPGRLRSTAR